MFMELIFCITFFLLPILGMFAAILLRREKEEEKKEEKGISPASKRTYARSSYPKPVLVKNKIMQYQLIERQIHKPMVFSDFKEQIHSRAGP